MAIKIQKIGAREIINALGKPALEVHMTLSDGFETCASAPLGTSIGKHEACAVTRAADPQDLMWLSIQLIESFINSALRGMRPDIALVDAALLKIDCTADKHICGTAVLLGIGIVTARAQAHVEQISLVEVINRLAGVGKPGRPRILANVINGGCHARAPIEKKMTIQEMLIGFRLPVPINQQINGIGQIYRLLEQKIIAADFAAAIGDEGGFVLPTGMHAEVQGLTLIHQTITELGLEKNVIVGIDAAASEFYDTTRSCYYWHDQMIDLQQLIKQYQSMMAVGPLAFIEDGCAQDDWDGWRVLQAQFPDTLLIGDDLFASHADRIAQGVRTGFRGGIIIKPNQAGTLTEALAAVRAAHAANYTLIVSHRSGETNDDFIADFAVAIGAWGIKCGAPVRGERIAKYNRLLALDSLF